MHDCSLTARSASHELGAASGSGRDEPESGERRPLARTLSRPFQFSTGGLFSTLFRFNDEERWSVLQ